MTRIRIVLLGIVAVVIAAVCIRLGIWQLDRLKQRRTDNARIAVGIAGAPVEMDAVGSDSTRSRALRVHVRGRYDFDNEIVLINRSREGAPGVNLLTPVRVEGRDTAVLVNRGWVYSPDGSTVDVARWREPIDASGTAYVSWLPRLTGRDAASSDAGQSMRVNGGAGARRVARTDRGELARLLPYPIAPYQLILLDSSSESGVARRADAAAPMGTEAPIDQTRPVRIALPSLEEGPHKSYAIQWFSFAAIALIGTGAVARAEWSRSRGGTAL